MTWLRNCSRLKSSTETPRTAKFWGSNFALARLKSAGTSLRFVRSPAAPNNTITQGPAALPAGWLSCSRFVVAAVAIKRPVRQTCGTRAEHCRPLKFGFHNGAPGVPSATPYRFVMPTAAGNAGATRADSASYKGLVLSDTVQRESSPSAMNLQCSCCSVT